VHPAIFCLSSLLGILAIFSATCPNNIDGELVRVSGASGNNAGLFRNNAPILLPHPDYTIAMSGCFISKVLCKSYFVISLL